MASRGRKLERGESSRARECGDSGDVATPRRGPRGEDESPAAVSKTQCRAIRSGYRNLTTMITGEKEKLARDAKTFNALIGQVDTLFGKVERPREQRADLEAIAGLTSSLLEYAKKVQEKTGPTPADLVTTLLNQYQVNLEQDGVHINWEALGTDTMNVICDASGVITMIGPMTIEPKMRKKCTARRREQVGPSTRPEEVVEEANNQSTDTDKNIEALFKILRTHRRVRFEALVLNRRSFAQTVENIFALSFLVKDGRVEIACESDDTHYVVPKNAPTANDRAGGKVVNSQFVLRMDYKDWLFMKQTVEAGKELMPDRETPARRKDKEPVNNYPTCSTPVKTQDKEPVDNSPPSASLTPVRLTSRNRARGNQVQKDEQEDEAETSRRSKRSRSRI